MAELLGKSLAGVLEQLAKECRATADEAERRLMKAAERNAALDAELPRVKDRREEDNRTREHHAGETENAGTEAPAKCIQGGLAKTGVSRSTLMLRGNKPMSTRAVPMRLVLVVDNTR